MEHMLLIDDTIPGYTSTRPPVIRILKCGANDYHQIIVVIIFHNLIIVCSCKRSFTASMKIIPINK